MRHSTIKLITSGAALLVFTMISCTKDIVLSDESAYDNQKQISVTKSGEHEFKVTLSDVEWLMESLYPEAGAYEIEAYPNNEDPLMYAVNFDDGWKIVSGDKRTDPILAFNEDGKMWINDKSNPGFKMWLEEVSESIKKLDGIKEEDEKNLRFWKYSLPQKEEYETKSGSGRWYRQLIGEYLYGSYVNTIGPLITTKWGQQYPWNLKAPLRNGSSTHCDLGCVPVATAQLLYYFHYYDTNPQGLYHTIVGNDSGCIDYMFYWIAVFNVTRGDLTSPSSRWSHMPTDSLSAIANLTYAQYVGDLIIDVGDRLGVKYYSFGTEGHDENVDDALSFYGLTGSLSSYNYSYIYNDLTDSRPVYIGAGSNSYPDHAWLIDGYREELITTRRIYIWHEADSNWIGETFTTTEAQALLGDEIILEEGVGYLETTEEIGAKYFHMNWGWNGRYDGYFVTNASWKSYDINKNIVYNIHSVQ